MAQQLSMFAPQRPCERTATGKKRRETRAAKPTIWARFQEFHAQNPHVLGAMHALAVQHLASGATRIGVKALWEELREHLRVQKTGEYKLDNSYTALYARALIELDPQLADVIETRRRKSK